MARDARCDLERDADAGAIADRLSVLRRGRELPRLGRGDDHAVLISIGRRDQAHLFDGARALTMISRMPISSDAASDWRSAGQMRSHQHGGLDVLRVGRVDGLIAHDRRRALPV